MLLEFSCKNQKAIKENVMFSMLATKDSSMENELIDYKGIKVLRTATIYGANGSGKSSFLKSIRLLKTLVVSNISLQPGDEILRLPHKLSDINEPTEFVIQFTKKNNRYAYGISYLEDKVIEEFLYHFPNGRQAKIFERNYENVVISEKFKKALEMGLKVLKPNKLFLSCAANFGSSQEVEDVFMFFKDDIVLYTQEKNNNWFEYSVKKLQNDEVTKKVFMNFMKNIGTGLNDIRARYDKKKLDLNDIPEQFPDELKQFMMLGETNILDVKLEYEKFSIDLSDESSGIKKLFEILCPIFDILINDKILLCDEIETSLHRNIVIQIINLFKNMNNKKQAQLIFSTHDTSLLDLNLFRRDQIWFTELNPENRSVDLYSLSELKNVRKDENIYKGYILGKYGAIPMENKKIFDYLNNIISNKLEK